MYTSPSKCIIVRERYFVEIQIDMYFSLSNSQNIYGIYSVASTSINRVCVWRVVVRVPMPQYCLLHCVVQMYLQQVLICDFIDHRFIYV